MNRCITILMCQAAIGLSALAAIPLHWTVETTRAQPVTFDAYQGETLELEATLTSRGKPLELSGIAALYWQTNGMGSTYWEASAAVNSNRLSAVFTPEMDVGAKVYNCFIGVPGTIYHAAFQLRLRTSPGATPNVLPLPTPVIDFAKVRVLNPPWEGGGGGGVNTNAVRDIAREEITPATNRLYKTLIDSKDGAARPLPRYLHALDFADSYPDAAQEYYRSRGNGKTEGGCSSVRDGGFLYRNFDYPFDDRAEFVVKMSAGPGRFASVGVAQVGTNLTEQMVTSGKWSKWYKALPGATVDGINENGVACNINVVDGDPQWGGGVSPALHPLAAVRWILDNATNAQHAATYIASHIAFPPGWAQNFHYMVADESATYIVENGTAYQVTNGVPAMTNFRLYGDPKDTTGEGQERYIALTNGANITSQWWTLTYTPTGYRPSDLPGITGQDLANLFNYWENNPRESHRGEAFGDTVWWQSIHTSIYNLKNRTLRIAVQETDDWYTFSVPSGGAVKSVNGKTGDVKIDIPTVPEKWALADVTNETGDVIQAYDLDAYTRDEVDARDSILEDDMIAYDDELREELGERIDEAKDIAESAGDMAYEAASDARGAVIATENLDVEKADRSMISATDPTFSNAVDTIVRSIMPTTLRAYDPVRQCWWNIQPVNGVLTLTVED